MRGSATRDSFPPGKESASIQMPLCVLTNKIWMKLLNNYRLHQSLPRTHKRILRPGCHWSCRYHSGPSIIPPGDWLTAQWAFWPVKEASDMVRRWVGGGAWLAGCGRGVCWNQFHNFQTQMSGNAMLSRDSHNMVSCARLLVIVMANFQLRYSSSDRNCRYMADWLLSAHAMMHEAYSSSGFIK